MGGVLLFKGAGQPDDLSGEPPPAGLQDPALGVGEAGEVEGQELLEGVLGLVEAGLEVPRRGAQGRGGRLAGTGQGAPRVAQERLAGGRVVGRTAPGGEPRLGLPRAQAVARDGLGQARLLPTRQRRQGGGRGGGEPPVIDAPGQLRGEPAAEGQAPLHPAPAAAQELGDPGERQVVVVGQGADHAGLVHGTQRAPRGVGLEQAGLAHDAGGVLDDHRHVGVAVAGPARQALEAVEDLVGPVADRGDAQGQRGQGARGIGARPPQRRERRGEPLEGEVAHERHGRGSSRGRSWYSG
jgi:hypothetical protein